MIQWLPSALKQTILYGASIALMKGMSLLMLPFLAHHLTENDFGRLEVISSLAIIGSILVGMGLEDTLFRFAGAVKNLNQRKQLAAEIFALTLIIGSLTGMAGWFIAGYLATQLPGSASTYEIQLVLAMLALEGVIAIPLGWLRMRNKAITFFTASTGRALLQAILVLVLISADRGVKGVLEAGLIAAITQAIILSWLQIKDTGLRLNLKTGKQSLVYSLPIMASGLVAFALNGLDRWVLAEYASLTDVAHFGVAAKFALAVVLLLQPFGMWWSPKRFEVLYQDNGHQLTTRYISIGIALTLIITVFIGLSSPLLITWLLPESYIVSSQYAIGLVAIMALKEISELVNLGCFVGKTTRVQLAINIISAILGIACMLILTPNYAVWGVILSLIIAQGVRLLLFLLASQYFLFLPYPTGAITCLVMVGILWLSPGLLALKPGYQLLLTVAGTTSMILTALFLKVLPLPEGLTQKVLSRWA